MCGWLGTYSSVRGLASGSLCRRQSRERGLGGPPESSFSESSESQGRRDAALPGLVRACLPVHLCAHPGGLRCLHLLLRARLAGGAQVAHAAPPGGPRLPQDADGPRQPGFRGPRGLSCPVLVAVGDALSLAIQPGDPGAEGGHPWSSGRSLCSLAPPRRRCSGRTPAVQGWGTWSALRCRCC